MKYLVLDTNALPLMDSLSSTFFQTLLRISNHLEYKPCIPEIVRTESLNLRRSEAAKSIDTLSESFKNASRLFDLPDFYIPSAGDAVDRYETELDNVFQVLPLSGDAAIESFHREARRQRPAQNGIGGRDTTIWLTIVELLKTDNSVAFISNNKKDFGDKGLHVELEAEIKDLPGSLEFYTSAYWFLASEATAMQVLPLDDTHAYDAFADLALDSLSTRISSEYRSWEQANELVQESNLEITDASFNSGFSVGLDALAKCAANFRLTSGTENLSIASGTLEGLVTFETKYYRTSASEVKLRDVKLNLP